MIIEKNIPVTPSKGYKYSFIHTMEVGDSISVADMTKLEARYFYIGMQTFGSRNGGLRFRKSGDRIWRVK